MSSLHGICLHHLQFWLVFYCPTYWTVVGRFYTLMKPSLYSLLLDTTLRDFFFFQKPPVSQSFISILSVLIFHSWQIHFISLSVCITNSFEGHVWRVYLVSIGKVWEGKGYGREERKKRERIRETEERVGVGIKDAGGCLFRRAGRGRKRKRESW